MSFRTALYTAILLLTACYDSRFQEPDKKGHAPNPTECIATLCRRYAGSPFTVESEIRVAGRITSCDLAGNFYRTLCIEDDDAGLEIMAGIDHLHNDFPIGCRVVVSLQGLTVARNRGVIQIGRAPAPGSRYTVDYIGSRAALDRIIIRSDETITCPTPSRLPIGGLTPDRCGTLVRIDELQYSPDELSASTWSGYKRFENQQGEAIYTYVRHYARFADEEVPTQKVSLVGILEKEETEKGRYMIRLRNEQDCID